jgi:hypothetical protein
MVGFPDKMQAWAGMLQTPILGALRRPSVIFGLRNDNKPLSYYHFVLKM